MDLASVDLNLLVALRALLEERNVTRAGRRLGLSQPAASAALARLRHHFGDELLVRKGNGYELTPLGTALLTPTETAYQLLARLFTSRADFDPATERREFTVLASDYAVAVFGAALVRALADRAPGVRLSFRHIGAEVVENTDGALSAVDGVLMPHGVISDMPAVDLFQDEWVCLVAADHPEIGDRLVLEDLARLPWVVYQRAFDTPVTRQLSMLGLQPRVEVSAQSFQLLPTLVAGTRRIALIQRRLAELMLPVAPVRVLPCPFDAVPLQEALWWHPVHTHDAGHGWLREVAAELAATIAAPGHHPRTSAARQDGQGTSDG